MPWFFSSMAVPNIPNSHPVHHLPYLFLVQYQLYILDVTFERLVVGCFEFITLRNRLNYRSVVPCFAYIYYLQLPSLYLYFSALHQHLSLIGSAFHKMLKMFAEKISRAKSMRMLLHITFQKLLFLGEVRLPKLIFPLI